MSRLDHFLILYRFSPTAPPFSPRERERLVQRWDGRVNVIDRDPFLIAWGGPVPLDERAAILHLVGNPYNVGTARAVDIAAGVVEAVGELDGAFAGFAFNPLLPGSSSGTLSGECTLVTDRFGLMPLYVHEADGVLCYSTSLALLLALRQPVCQVDPASVCEMLILHMVLGNGTLFRDIRLVPPATAVHLRPRSIPSSESASGTAIGAPPASVVYWNWKDLAPAATAEESLDLVHETYALIEQAVLRGVPSNAVRVAVPLSGGLDSRMLLAVLTRHDVPVQTYTLDYGRESPIAREVARTLGVPRRGLPMWDAPGTIPEALAAVDCGYHANQMWGWEMARRAAEEDGCQVLFDGLAFDAILGAVLRTPGETVSELVRGLEAAYVDIDEESLGKVIGASARTTIFPSVRASLEDLARVAIESAGPLASDQFLMTNRVRKYTFGYCLANLPHLPGRFPYVTTRLFEHCMRLPMALRLEHNLYRRIYRELFPELARIPWAKTGVPLDRYVSSHHSRWWLLLEAALRRASRGRLHLAARGSFDVAFRKRKALREVFLEGLYASTPGLESVLPADAAGRIVESSLAGRNLGGLLQGLYTVKQFLTRFVGPGMARLRG